MTEPAAEARRRLGEKIAQARTGLGMTQEALAARTRLALRTLGNIERGSAHMPSRRTKYEIERALGWTEGDFDRVLDGGEPTPAPARAYTNNNIEEDEVFVYRALRHASPETIREVRAFLERHLD